MHADAAVDALLSLGAGAVLLKGGHLPGTGDMVDRLGVGSQRHRFVHPRLALEGHGTGCTLASSIAANLCRGLPLDRACADAADYVHGALVHGLRPGKSNMVVLAHFWRGKQA